MFRNKKGIVIEALVRITIVVAIFILIIFPACNKLSAGIYGESDVEMFSAFVTKLNDLQDNTQKPVFLKIKKKEQAIIGFSKDSSGYQFTSSPLIKSGKEKQILFFEFKKPNTPECTETSCMCLCKKGFGTEENSQLITCEQLYCEKLNFDIINPNLISLSTHPSINNYDLHYWEGGFLIGRGIKSDYNGIPRENNQRTIKVIEKRKIGNKLFLGVCTVNNEKINTPSVNYLKDHFDDKCIISEFEQGLLFEEIADNIEKYGKIANYKEVNKDELYRSAIKKYEETIKKYEKGIEVEEAMFNMGLIYKTKLSTINLGMARATFKEFLEKFPDSEIAFIVEATMQDPDEKDRINLRP
ncbi:hypothetical protein GOV14_04730 [Candidatus Pacearchaeota archaeon]|nr:hypothetical protein [Candidatus Pacearchaeota archaeon]